MTTKIFVFLLALASFAFGQNLTLGGENGKFSWTKNSVSVSLPNMSGGGIVNEYEQNSDDHKIFVVARDPGEYFVRGTSCSFDGLAGDQRSLARFSRNSNAQGQHPTVLMVHDTSMFHVAEPNSDPLCKIELFRQFGGRIEVVVLDDLNSYHPPSTSFYFAGEGVDQNGRYFVNLIGNPVKDATIIIGHSGVSVGVEYNSPVGMSKIYFDESLYLPGFAGLTTLTFFQNGESQSLTYFRRITVQTPRYGPKG
jgi:hypothetical protein